jgi:hypothetical protein
LLHWARFSLKAGVTSPTTSPRRFRIGKNA